MVEEENQELKQKIIQFDKVQKKLKGIRADILELEQMVAATKPNGQPHEDKEEETRGRINKSIVKILRGLSIGGLKIDGNDLEIDLGYPIEERNYRKGSYIQIIVEILKVVLRV